ncbi:hypothetical protein ACF1AB_40850 [Streptomyces sp. NPDC014846]
MGETFGLVDDVYVSAGSKLPPSSPRAVVLEAPADAGRLTET